MKHKFIQRTEVVVKTDLELNLSSDEADWLHTMLLSFDPLDMPSDMTLFHKKMLGILQR